MIVNGRLGRAGARLARPYKLFGRDRETASEAYAGDIVGLVNPGRFAIGDSLYSGRPVQFPAIRASPRSTSAGCASRTRATSSSTMACGSWRRKGLMQVLFSRSGGRDPIVGVVGALQFDVIAGAPPVRVRRRQPRRPLSLHVGAGIEGDSGRRLTRRPRDERARHHQPRRTQILLFPSASALEYAERQNPGVRFVAEM